MWSQVGVELELQQLESGLLWDNYQKNDYEVMPVFWTNDIIDPDQLTAYALYYPSAESFHTGFNNAEVNALWSRHVLSLTPAPRPALSPDSGNRHAGDSLSSALLSAICRGIVEQNA